MAFKGFLQLTAKTSKTQQGKETTCKLTQLYTHSHTDKLVTITQVGSFFFFFFKC